MSLLEPEDKKGNMYMIETITMVKNTYVICGDSIEDAFSECIYQSDNADNPLATEPMEPIVTDVLKKDIVCTGKKISLDKLNKFVRKYNKENRDSGETLLYQDVVSKIHNIVYD